MPNNKQNLKEKKKAMTLLISNNYKQKVVKIKPKSEIHTNCVCGNWPMWSMGHMKLRVRGQGLERMGK